MDDQTEFLILDQDLVEKIDKHRSSFTRVQFIDFCINYCRCQIRSANANSEDNQTDGLESTSGQRLQVSYVTKGDLQEYSQDMKYLLRVSLDFFITFDMELGIAEPIVDNHYQRSGIEEYRQNLPIMEPEEAITTSFPQAYCLKCRKMVDIQNPSRVVLKNKTFALTGLCPISGTPVFRFLK